MKRYTVKGLFFTVIVALLFLPSCGGEGDGKPKGGAHGGAMTARAANVRTWTAVSGDVAITIKAVGTLEAEEEVVVSAEVAGTLTRLLRDEGAGVETGTVLAVIDEEKFKLSQCKFERDFCRLLIPMELFHDGNSLFALFRCLFFCVFLNFFS